MRRPRTSKARSTAIKRSAIQRHHEEDQEQERSPCQCLLCQRRAPFVLLRSSVAWTSIARVVLYVLHRLHPDTVYLTTKLHISPFIRKHWELLGMARKDDAGRWKKHVLDALGHNDITFQSGFKTHQLKRGMYMLIDQETDPWDLQSYLSWLQPEDGTLSSSSSSSSSVNSRSAACRSRKRQRLNPLEEATDRASPKLTRRRSFVCASSVASTSSIGFQRVGMSNSCPNLLSTSYQEAYSRPSVKISGASQIEHSASRKITYMPCNTISTDVQSALPGIFRSTTSSPALSTTPIPPPLLPPVSSLLAHVDQYWNTRGFDRSITLPSLTLAPIISLPDPHSGFFESHRMTPSFLPPSYP